MGDLDKCAEPKLERLPPPDGSIVIDIHRSRDLFGAYVRFEGGLAGMYSIHSTLYIIVSLKSLRLNALFIY